jgi:hypothetical protein
MHYLELDGSDAEGRGPSADRTPPGVALTKAAADTAAFLRLAAVQSRIDMLYHRQMVLALRRLRYASEHASSVQRS